MLRSVIDSMPSKPMDPKRKRPHPLVVYLDEKERRELIKAATQSGMALSVFVRAVALGAVRRGGVRIEPAA
jgi:hypothetical protein